MTELREAVMVDFARTPFGRASKKKPGFFANVRSDDLGIIAVQAIMKRTKVDPASVDDIIIGTPTQLAEQAQAARNITLGAGFPFEVPGLTVDRACGSSLAGAQVGVMAIETVEPDACLTCTVGFNNVFGNTEANWTNYPPAHGSLTTTNANGHPVDVHMNLSVDPLFVSADDYHLQSSSPLIGAGTYLNGITPEYDFDGDLRLEPLDIGFDEATQ